MERNISPAAILCIVLVSLACVIGIGYGAFAITKGSANEGTQEVASQTSYASNSWKDDYDAKDVTGAQVQSLVKGAESKGIAVFINTRGMSQGTINSAAEVPVLKHNGKYYMNYGTVFDYEDDSYKKTSGEISMSDNSGLLGVRDGSSLKVDYNPKLQDGKLVRHEDYTGLYTNGAINYIDTHAKFRSNLIYGNDGEVVGVILSQVNRPGASLPLSSGGGFVNGSGSLGGTSGAYIPSHSGGGNIPLTGGNGGSSSYAPSIGGANASGPSTKPSTPAPETAAGEHLITFDTRGGSTIDYQKVATGGKVTKPSAPSRTGYGFAGWYTDSSCTTKYNFSRVINTDVTLYARWFMWGDADNDGKVTREDSKLAAQWRDGTFDNLVLPCSVYVYTALSEKNIGNADVILIGNKANYSLSSFKVDSTTRGYEFDLENGYYYDTQGNKYKLPTNKAAGLIPIPTGCTYYVGVTGSDFGDYTGATAVLKAGDIFPEAKNGDVVIYGDYEYRLTTLGSWEVKVIDKTKSSYGPILSEINDVSVVYMMSTFKDCSNMKKAPEIPETVTNIHYAFANCTSLETAPILHSGVMVPAYAFQNCTSLTGTVVIHANITGTSYTGCFSGTEKPILLKGTCSKLREFASTGEKGNVTVFGLNTIPAGATYYVGVISNILGNYSGATQTLTAGNAFPSEVKPGDVYVCGDYEYRYRKFYNYSQWDSSMTSGWGVRPLNSFKEEYGEILSNINGVDITSLEYTFDGCDSFKVAPAIPNGVVNMYATFQGCTLLSTAPVIPNGVTTLEATFASCTSLKEAPAIPSSVTCLDSTFCGCISLTRAPIIPTNVNNMSSTFADCSSLISAPVIPSSVTIVNYLFHYCTSLTGEIEINATRLNNSYVVENAFYGTKLPIVLTGSCEKLDVLAATSPKGNVTVKGSNTIPVSVQY